MKQQDPLHELYKNILEGSAKPGDKEQLAMWMARFDAPRKEISAEDLLQEQRQAQMELKKHFFPPAKSISFLRTWITAACFILVFLGILLVVKIRKNPTGKNTEVAYARNSTAAGEKKLVILGDGSRVFMNGESSISYQQAFAGKTREIYLQGQAYFQVSHNKNRPFIIHTGKLKVQVLGTTFDIKNYADDPGATVTVGSGKVSVNAQEHKGTWILSPGQQLSYDPNSGKTVKKEVDTADYLSWRDGALTFRNVELRGIARELQRAYGVKIHIKQTGLDTRKFSLRIREKENITQIMEMLSTAGSFRYSIRDRTVSISK